MTIVVVKMSHVRKAKMCSGGARRFFAKHNLDWADFLENGISSDKLEAIGDQMALDCVEIARGRK